MHGPDGTDYQEWITWQEIIPSERIELLHGAFRDDPDAFTSVLTFEPIGDQTRIVMRTVFPTRELRDEAVQRYHAIEGGEGGREDGKGTGRREIAEQVRGRERIDEGQELRRGAELGGNVEAGGTCRGRCDQRAERAGDEMTTIHRKLPSRAMCLS